MTSVQALRPEQPTAMPKALAAYMYTDEGAAVAREVGQKLSDGAGAIHGGGLSAAARVCTGTPLAATVLAELGQLSLDEARECIAELAGSGGRVIVIGDRDDLFTYRALLKAGAHEYFAFPVAADEVIAATQNRSSDTTAAPAAAPAKAQHRIAVLGCAGGVGASLLAQNLAFHLSGAKGAGLRTALLDADLQFGTQAIDLDRSDTPGLLEALGAPERVDATLLEATMEKLDERLFLYSHQPQLALKCGHDAKALARLIDVLSGAFEAVVTDVPRSEISGNPALAASFDVLVPVLPGGYAGVNAATRLLSSIKSHAPELTVLPVLSTFRQDAALTGKDIAKALGQDIRATLPRSDAALKRAHRQARPLVQLQPRGAYARAIRELVALMPVTRDGATASAKRGLFSRFTR